MNERIDIVYTWVDDNWPGFKEVLEQHALTSIDRNPNRFRDNLSLLRFSLRSVERFAPWRGLIHIVTCRPQCPSWLNRQHPGLRLVHHDELMPPHILPTFNSFAIQSYLHKIPSLSSRFVSFDDDMLLLNETSPEDFTGNDGRILYQFKGLLPHRKIRNSDSPWTATLLNNSRLLHQLFPQNRHLGYAHGPKLYSIKACVEIIDRWSSEFEHTRLSRFRSRDNVCIEALLPQYLVAMRRARAVNQHAAYLGLENVDYWNRFWLWWIRERRAKFLTLNDNFGSSPNPKAVRNIARILENLFPQLSSFELQS